MYTSFRFLLFFFCILTGTDHAQTQIDTIQIDPFLDKPLSSFMEKTEKEYEIHYFFKDEWIDQIVLSNPHRTSLSEFLRASLNQHGIDVVFRQNNIILYLEEENFFRDPANIESGVVVVGEDKPFAEHGEEVVWSGTVTDGKKQIPLEGVNVIVNSGESGAKTDSQGNFLLRLTPEVYEVYFRYVGYEPTQLKVLIKNSGQLDVELYETSTFLDEVTVSGVAKDVNVSSTSLGTDRLNIKTIEKMPAFLGEVDVVKSLLLLPGVSTIGEGSGGMNVRGGSTDQNLVLFDQSTVYNSSHLFGFFSNFNPDVVEKVSLYKGSVPAMYGDRVSAVLDIESTNLKHDKFKLRGGIGLVSSRLVTEIPLVKNKSSILLGGRLTYSDWLLREVNDINIRQSKASFYDVNFKWAAELGEKDKVVVSSYLSSDEFKFAADTLYNWQTKNASFIWDHVFNKMLSGRFVADYGDYYYDVEGLTPRYNFNLRSGLNERSAGFSLFYAPASSHTFSGGGKFSYFQFNPGELLTSGLESEVIPTELDEEQSREFAGYIQDEYVLNTSLSFVAGLRYSYFQNLGPSEVLQYQEGETINRDAVVDTLRFASGETVASYGGFEPRFSVKYLLNASSSIKLGFNRIRQYLQVISNTASITPVDIWKPSGFHVKPLIGNQLSLGYFRNFQDNRFETSAEVYYKKLDNVVDYKDGAELLLNKAIEQEMLSGIGRAYGLELFLKKSTGRLTGWASYTYSRSERRIEGPDQETTINRGRYYPAGFDQPHSISVVASYEVTKRLIAGANFTFNSGRPVTAPIAKFSIDGSKVAYFSERNQYRIPDYHRLDLSFTIKGGYKKNKLLNGDWTFSIYNVYARQNAYSVFFKNEAGVPPQAYKLSVLGTAFPSITYNFNL